MVATNVAFIFGGIWFGTQCLWYMTHNHPVACLLSFCFAIVCLVPVKVWADKEHSGD